MQIIVVVGIGVWVLLAGIFGVWRAKGLSGWARVRRVAASLVLVLSGFALLWIPFIQARNQNSLSPRTGKPLSIDISPIGRWEKPIAHITEPTLLDDWKNSFSHCESLLLNHPLYRDKYTAIVHYRAGDLYYNLRLDTQVPNTVDLDPFDVGNFLGITTERSYGNYRCDGQFDFLTKALKKP